MRRERLSKHFNASEFECHCCGLVNVSPRLVDALERLRALCGDAPIHVNSGCRCEPWNERVGGAVGSLHTYGKAADIVVQGHEPVEVADKAEQVVEFRHGGIGIYQNFVHVDVRQGGAARWHG